MLIATHDGTFHADETTACAVITYLYDNTTIIRTRDEELMETADLIIDVSLKNDERHYDHHSKDFTLVRDNGIRYATAGLMWRKFGREFLKKVANRELPFKPSASVLDAAFSRIDSEIMEMIDLNDNGQLTSYVSEVADAFTEGEKDVRNRLTEFYQCSPDIPYIVAMQNLPSNKGEQQDRAFNATVKMLRLILVPCAINALTTESGIERVLEVYQGGQILVMQERLPWTQAVFSHPDRFKECKLAVYPDRNLRWRVQSLPVSKALKFCNRCSAPISWRGLEGVKLDQVSGLLNCSFVHRSGFTGGAETYDDTMKMAKLWLEIGEHYQKD